jgi:DNA-directed RNA polymerase specialized sigma subunit
MDERLISEQDARTEATLASAILFLLSDRRYFTQREERIFTECACNGRAHEAMGKELGISRTRVSQILTRTKDKLLDRMSLDTGIRRLIIKWRA